MDSYIDSLRTEDYFIQRSHHNFFNKLYYNDFVKKWMPFYEYRSFHPFERQRAAHWYGRSPQATWVDGIIDYTYNKHNVNSIGHFHLHENRKNKPQKSQDGGDATHGQRAYPKYAYLHAPQGCNKEIQKYQECKKSPGVDCTEQKINIVEVCPKWVLELMREKKKILLKATIIDNKTYREAMKVESYNKHRSLIDLKDKNAHLKTIRRDGYWADDRYSPVEYPSADQNSNIIQGDSLIYNDVLGGNRIEKITQSRNEAMAAETD